MPRANPAARGYDAAWRKVRTAKLRRNPVCEDCARRGALTAASVVDHIETIRARPELRLAMGNLQSLCKPCHDSAKALEELHGYAPGFDLNGDPVDGRHPSHAAQKR